MAHAARCHDAGMMWSVKHLTFQKVSSTMRITLLLALLFACWHLQAQEYSLPPVPEWPVYGSSCGFVGAEPPERERLEKLIHFRNKVGVLNMLNDSLLVMQAYGAEGVIRLQQRGVSFDHATVARIAELRKSNALIRTCSGCIFSLMPLGISLNANVSRTLDR
jgi:hypothetical protein